MGPQPDVARPRANPDPGDPEEQARTANDLAALNRQVRDALYDRGEAPIQAQAMDWLLSQKLTGREWQVAALIYRWTFASGKNWKPLATVARQQLLEVLGLRPGARSIMRLTEAVDALVGGGILRRIRSLGRSAAIWRLGVVDVLLASRDGNGIAADDDAASAALQALQHCEQAADRRYQERVEHVSQRVTGSDHGLLQGQPVTGSDHGLAESQPVTESGLSTRNRNARPTRNTIRPRIALRESHRSISQPADAGAPVEKAQTYTDEQARRALQLAQARGWSATQVLESMKILGAEATLQALTDEDAVF